jgi:hypothetical protein
MHPYIIRATACATSPFILRVRIDTTDHNPNTTKMESVETHLKTLLT